jgi:serine/threonine-protein kinase
MPQAVWYCPLCQSEGDDPGTVFCRADGGRVRPLAERGSDWIGKVLAEKYKVTRFIDSGGTAEVYEAERVGTGKRVAVKLLHAAFAAKKDMMESFLQEAQLVSLIAHPNIVAIHDFGTLPGAIHFMVMELLDGRPLSAEIARGPLPVLTALKYAMQVCEGLAAAHARDVIHCDIKPANIFLQKDAEGRDYTVKILDLGIGRLFAGGRAVGLDAPGIVAGTPEYMSPEQAQGQSLGPASDIYSMGCAIYEMLIGQEPFIGSSYVQLLQQHVHAAPPWPEAIADERQLPSGTRDVLWRALAKEPKARQGSMLELQRDLAALSRDVKSRVTTRDLPRADTMPAPSMPSDRARITKRRASARIAREETFTAEEDGSGRWRSPPVSRRSSKRPLTNIVPLAMTTGSDSEVVELAPDVYWVGRRHGKLLEHNAFLRIFKRGGVESGVVIDPGPAKDLGVVTAKVTAILGSKPFDYASLDDEDGRTTIANLRELVVVPTPFCHVRSAAMLYDRASRVLFSGDLFGGARAPNLAFDERSMAGVTMFHELSMPTRRAIALAVARVRRLDPQPLVIAPRHGALVTGESVGTMLDAIERLDVGLDRLESPPSSLSPKAPDADARCVDAANELVRELAEVAGKDMARDLVMISKEEMSFASMVVVGDDGDIAGFKVTARLALDALAADALAALPAERRGDLRRSVRAIWKAHALESDSIPAASRRETSR